MIRRRPDVRTLKQLRAAGWTVEALAARFGMSRWAVYRLAPGPSPGQAEPAWRDDWPDPRFYPAPRRSAASAPLPSASESTASPDITAPARTPIACGSMHGLSKLTESDVYELRQFRLAGWTMAALARHYSINERTVSNIIAGRTWRHVPMPQSTPDAPDIGPHP